MELVKRHMTLITCANAFAYSFLSKSNVIYVGARRGSTACFHLEEKTNSETKSEKAHNPTFTEEDYNETSSYIENGMRKVYPYYFSYRTFAKARWFGRNIVDAFMNEFQVRQTPIEEYERRIHAGLITVNSERVNIDYKIKENDLLISTVHRHELPVCNEPITVVHQDEDILVVNKPASIPVHPTGNYRHNTLMFILAKEYNLKNVYPIHRLDRLTSGLMICRCRPTSNGNVSLEEQFHKDKLRKEYVCRVEGDFPEGEIVCQMPIKNVSRMICICRVSSRGKHSTTVFKKLSGDGKTSLVLCTPLTGRTHQIRVHLQYLGYPIIKDPLYNNNTLFGPEKGKGGRIGKSNQQLISDVIQLYSNMNYYGLQNHPNHQLRENNNGQNNICDKINLFSSKDKRNMLNVPPNMTFNPEKLFIDEYCTECNRLYHDPKLTDLFMCLHSWKYKGSHWTFETELPVWATDGWEEQCP